MLDELDVRKSSITKELGGQIAIKKAEVARLSTLVNNGYEYRNIECRWVLDAPERGRKTLFRVDTGEEVRSARMDDDDRQISMEFDREREAAEAAAKVDESRLIEAPSPMASAETIEVDAAVELIDDANGTYWLAEGHIDRLDFLSRAHKVAGDDVELRSAAVKHLYRRRDGNGAFGWCKKKDAAAEPVTIVNFERVKEPALTH